MKLWMPHHGSIQGQVEWGFEKPDLIDVVPAYGRGVEIT